jgi:hypothetical protein
MSQKNDEVVTGTTCFIEHKKACVPCQNIQCKYWMEHKQSNNCTMIAASNGEMTLQDIGDIFKITRMRVCQIEKSVTKKIMQKISNLSDELSY